MKQIYSLSFFFLPILGRLISFLNTAWCRHDACVTTLNFYFNEYAVRVLVLLLFTAFHSSSTLFSTAYFYLKHEPSRPHCHFYFFFASRSVWNISVWLEAREVSQPQVSAWNAKVNPSCVAWLSYHLTLMNFYWRTPKAKRGVIITGLAIYCLDARTLERFCKDVRTKFRNLLEPVI